MATSKVKTSKFKYPVSNQFGNFFSDQPSTRYGIIENRGLDKTILEDFKKGISVKQLARKHRLAEGTVIKFVKSKIPKKEYDRLTKLKQTHFFDQSIVKDLKKDAKTMSRREVVNKYKGKVSDTTIDRLVKKGEIKFGVVEESGRPRVSEEMKDMDKVKRARGIKQSQKFNIHGNPTIHFHHIMPIRGLANIQTGDVGLLNKYLNSELGGSNQKLNDLEEEIANLDMNKPGSIKKLDELNKLSAKEVDRAKTKLPAKYKGMVGYVRYEPIFDENGVVIELSPFREGVDNTGSKFSKGLPENIKDMSPERLKEYKTYVKTNADDLLKKTKTLSHASKIKICKFLNSGGLPGDCAQAIKKNPKKAAEVLSEISPTDEKMKAVKGSAQKLRSLLPVTPNTPVLTPEKLPVTPETALPKVEKLKTLEVFDKKPPAVDPSSNIRWNNETGTFVNTETGNPVNQAELKTWADEHPMEVKVGEAKPGILKKTGKALAHLGLPLPTAAMDAYFIGREIEEGKSPEEIARNPLNWLGLATMDPLTKAAGMAEKSGKLASVMRLGMSPGMIRGATRFLGLPGLALSTGLTAYDQYQKYKNKEGFIYDLFNREEIDNAQV